MWSGQRQRQRRRRREHFGELVQMDGSFDEWLAGRGRRDCLPVMVDDATGETLCRLGEEETTWLAADVLRAWVERYGVPRALYVDWKNVYQRVPSPRERECGEQPLSQFGRMCAKLGIALVGANSPQAKGRVERNHGVHQDRLVTKLRRKKIMTLEQANRYLEQEYLPEHNRRFARAPAAGVDFHWEAPADLDRVFCLEEERVLAEDWVVRYHNRLLQVEAGQEAWVKPGGKLRVCEYRDGSLHLWAGERELCWREIAERPALAPVAKMVARQRAARKPAADHPWRRAFLGGAADKHKAVEMAGGGKPWRGFPPPLENAAAFPPFPPPHDCDGSSRRKTRKGHF